MTETMTNLTAQLQHPDYNVRSQAALSLGKLGDVSAIEALLYSLSTEMDLYVREDITWSLVRMGNAAIGPLINLLRDPNPAVRHHAAHTLGKIGDEKAIDALIAVLQADEDTTVITKAAFALSQIGDVKAVPALVRLLGHEHREVQAMINNVLERFGEAVIQPVVQELENERWQIREQAADVLGLVGNQETVPMLVNALNDEHWQVRFAAVTALGHLGGVQARKALQSVQNDTDERVQALVAKVLRRTR